MFKKVLKHILESKVKRYFKKHKPVLVVVVGSVGKTSTKQAIATVLAERFKVRAHDGNYNSEFSVPVALLGVKYPDNPRSFSEWRTVLGAMNIRIREAREVDVIVQELGTDRPGDIAQFRSYLHPDITVVTAVSEEHMENFGSLEDVAREELSIAAWSKLAVVNRDDVDGSYAKYADTQEIDTYGLSEQAEYRLAVEPASPLDGRIGQLTTPEWGEIPVNLQLIGDHSLKAAVAGACVGAKLGLTSRQVAVGVSKIVPTAGRMQVLRGLKHSMIIDDTYNSSPLAVRAALNTLYSVETPQRIAVLGSMNELGNHSSQLHEMVGSLCVPEQLDWVVTVGEEAEKYLAPAALRNGCQVKSFKSPYEAGGFVNKILKDHAVVLFKGSQNLIYLEEAVKVILHNNDDFDKLVRQSEYWLARKDAQFDRAVAED